jgi:hypothetical protein
VAPGAEDGRGFPLGYLLVAPGVGEAEPAGAVVGVVEVEGLAGPHEVSAASAGLPGVALEGGEEALAEGLVGAGEPAGSGGRDLSHGASVASRVSDGRHRYARRMREADEASERGRALAQLRWTPEARLRSAVQTVVENADQPDEAQRGQLREIAGGQKRDDGGNR